MRVCRRSVDGEDVGYEPGPGVQRTGERGVSERGQRTELVRVEFPKISDHVALSSTTAHSPRSTLTLLMDYTIHTTPPQHSHYG